MHRKPPASRRVFVRRTSGILLHLTSLRGEHGSGDLGPEAHRFLEFLERAGQSWWQMLLVGVPVRPPAVSPYDSPSAFAGSLWLVSLSVLARGGLLTSRDLEPAPGLSSRRVNFPATLRFREERLRRAFAGFRSRRGDRERDFRDFCDANAKWLEDFALFAALRRESGGKPWTDWEKDDRGHPQYRWTAHVQTGFAWWVRRFARVFELFDAVRIDHFLGFTRTWSIPADASSPTGGRWVKSPGPKLFAAVRRRLGARPMIAEDLGHVTAADIRLRDSFGLAPTRIFQHQTTQETA